MTIFFFAFLVTALVVCFDQEAWSVKLLVSLAIVLGMVYLPGPAKVVAPIGGLLFMALRRAMIQGGLA